MFLRCVPPPRGVSTGTKGTQAAQCRLCDMDLLDKLDGPDQWWFAPLIWAAAFAAIVLVLAYYVMGV